MKKTKFIEAQIVFALKQAENGTTKVKIVIYNESLERLERMIEMGFKEGFTMTLNYLEKLLASSSQK